MYVMFLRVLLEKDCNFYFQSGTWVKNLLCEHEDLHSDSHHAQKDLLRQCVGVSPALGWGAERGGCQGLLASHSSWLRSSKWVRDLVSRKVGGEQIRKIPKVSLSPLHAYICMQILRSRNPPCTYTCVHYTCTHAHMQYFNFHWICIH